MRTSLLVLLLMVSLHTETWSADTFPKFREHVIDPEVGRVCYAVTLADVDGDAADTVNGPTLRRTATCRTMELC